MNLSDHFATEFEVNEAVESAKNKLLSVDIRLPMTTKGILVLEWVAKQELAVKEKIGTFRLVSDGKLKDVVVLHGEAATNDWEDFDSFEKDGKSYVMYPDPFQP